MAIINTKLHGILDYSIAFVLILPWIVNYNATSQDSLVLASCGSLVLLYSLITNYEFGMIKLLPMRVHLVLDLLVGLFLILTPWLFDLYNYYGYWPIIIGIPMLVLTALSSSSAYRVTRRDLDITKP